ncbi:beta-galactosidase [Paenibacillus gansuensis]|uniref:Beta-galactosidase n=1 Tax=Paenibacillus gansuensis TaxID=306542 RepID=A0ABW5PB41_9BACL
MAKSIRNDRLQLGVCYYPEHWPESLWSDDFRRMREMNISVIRIAEFGWAILEPEEGNFRFELFDKAVDLAHEYGLQVILGTPTATPPAWLTEKYPEVLNASREGVLFRHGMRRHYNYSSAKYRELGNRITAKMAERYGNHPAVIGWQIDNELNCEISEFYAEADHAAFREWVRNKYGTLDRLNEAWGTVVWSQTYTDWGQIYLSRPNPGQSPNPHLLLDEKRFTSDNAISFAGEQADIIRAAAPSQWITTNGLFGRLDNHDLTEQHLDFFSYDSYPQFATIFPEGGVEPLMDRRWGASLSNVRSVSPQFCVMEQQAGPGGWVNRIEMASPRPGQLRLWTYQSVLHGADMVLYFRWRTATVGTEIYWHGINDYHNRPNRRVRELTQVGEEFTRLGELAAGSEYKAGIAIIRDYDNQWDAEFDVWHGPLNGQSVKSWYKQLQYQHIPADYLYLKNDTLVEDLLRYEVLVYPHPAILPDERAAVLEAYVRQGGKLVFGARTGYKDIHGRCPMRPLPGPVAGLCGITVEDFTLIKGTVEAPLLQWGAALENVKTTGGNEIRAAGFNDILSVEAEDVEVTAVYASDYYAGQPAMTKRKVGQGEVWYYGAAFSEPVVDKLLEWLGLESPVKEWLTLPKSVEMGIRSKDGQDLIFLLNYSGEPIAAASSRPVKDVLTGNMLHGEISLPAYGVMVLEQ